MSRLPTTPGWYNDPQGVYPLQAYWDGERWTGRTRRHRPWEWVAVAVLGAVIYVIGFGLFALVVGGM